MTARPVSVVAMSVTTPFGSMRTRPSGDDVTVRSPNGTGSTTVPSESLRTALILPTSPRSADEKLLGVTVSDASMTCVVATVGPSRLREKPTSTPAGS